MKHLIILTFCILFFSCNEKSNIIETNDFYLKIGKAIKNKKNYTNMISNSNLEINAENITLEKLLNTIFKNNALTFKFEKDKLADIKLQATILLKKETDYVKRELLETILNELNLNLVNEERLMFQLKIIDTIKLYKHYSINASNNYSQIQKSKDSISVKNVSLEKFSELLNERFKIKSYSKNTTAIIDYNCTSKDLTSLKVELKQNLGLELFDINNKQIIYIISDK